MITNITRIVFYICTTLIIITVLISCTLDEKNFRTYELEKTKIPKSNFEICVDSCPTGLRGTIQECVDKCISRIIDNKGG